MLDRNDTRGVGIAGSVAVSAGDRLINGTGLSRSLAPAPLLVGESLGELSSSARVHSVLVGIGLGEEK